MSDVLITLIVAAIVLILIPLTPHLMHLRIRMLRALHWDSMAGWHERHFRGLVLGARIAMVIVFLLLVVTVVTGI